MTVWWTERNERVNRAIEMVIAQTGCERSEALALLRQRAELTESDLDQTSIGVIAGRIRFGRLEQPPGACRHPKRVHSNAEPVRHTATSGACRPGSRRASR